MLSHVEDKMLDSFWNTPLKAKVNFERTVLDATLDTGASISAVNADIHEYHGFMGQRFYKRFVAIPELSTPIVLGIDFMKHASITRNVPTGTILTGDEPACLEEAADDGPDGSYPRQENPFPELMSRLISLQGGSFSPLLILHGVFGKWLSLRSPGR